MSGVVPEGLPLARIDGAAKVGVLVEPIGVELLIVLKVRDVGGGAGGIGGMAAAILHEDVQERVVVQIVIVGMKIDGDRLNDRSGMVAEFGKHEISGLKTSVPVAQGDPDPGVAEADDIGLAVAVQIGQEARVQRDSPALIVAEVRQDQLRTASSGD